MTKLLHAMPFATAAVLATTLTTTAQCGLDWQPGPIAAGPHGAVNSLAAGASGEVYAGGSFRYADAVTSPCIAHWNGVAWTDVGGGVGGGGLERVLAVARAPNGDVYVGGDFTSAGGVPANNIARWNGASWSPLGSGTSDDVTVLLALPNGDIVAGGLFQTAGGVAAPQVARWNGTAWSAFGNGPTVTPYALAQRPNGDLVAAGTRLGATAAMVWNGTTWTTIVNGGFGRAVAVLGNGDVVVGGQLSVGAVAANLVRWNGTAATVFANPLAGTLTSLSVAPNGDLVAGAAGNGGGIARWDGVAWTPFAGAPGLVNALAHDSTGSLLVATNLPGSTVLRWNGSAFVSLGNPVVPPAVTALARAADGGVFVGGAFTTFGGAAARNVAHWNGSAWTAFGGGVGGRVHALVGGPNGDLIVSGDFQDAGGAPANRVARWTGTAWTTLGGGLPTPARSLAVASNGDVYAVGLSDLRLRRFDGLTWTQIAIPPQWSPTPRVVAALPDGTIAVGGMIGSVLLYQNGAFTALAITGTAQALAVAPDGALVVSAGGSILRRNGASWTLLGQFPSVAADLAFLPDGDLVAAGFLTSGSSSVGVLRFDGAQWSTIDGGITRGAPTIVVASEHGDLFVGGDGSIEIAGGHLSLNFAHARTNCFAAAVSFGAGCAGGGGPMVLAANDLPWAGGTLTATATGFPAGSLGLLVAGDQSLVQPLPLGAPGCSLFVQPLMLDLLLPANGAAIAALAVPASASLAGMVFREQVVGLELDALGGLTRVTSTNALALTIGAL